MKKARTVWSELCLFQLKKIEIAEHFGDTKHVDFLKRYFNEMKSDVKDKLNSRKGWDL